MDSATFLSGRVTLHAGDCLTVLPTLDENSVDSCVCDPPYHLTSIVKRFGNGEPSHTKTARDIKSRSTPIARLASGFMNQKWDGGDVAFRPETWAAILRVLKPGAHLVAFAAPKNAHRMFCAIEDGGFEIRDTIAWLFGSGFPKSHNLKEQWQGWGTALKPAYEPICLARKPLVGTVAGNVLKHGVGAINIGACRVGTDDTRSPGGKTVLGVMNDDGWKPKPVIAGSAEGRWPANVIHDGSDEVVEAFPELGKSTGGRIGNAGGGTVANLPTGQFSKGNPGFGDAGSAARFFYTAKADSDDRLGSRHPTVKPLDLMQYLVRLVTPPKGVVLDCFAGTGTTAEAAWREGFNAVLIEREPEYLADIERRMSLCLAGPDERARESIKARQAGKPQDNGPLFDEAAA